MGNPVILGLIRSLHDLSSIMWIGSLLFLSLFLVPAVGLITDKKKKAEILDNIFDKLTYFIVISIIILAITGILEHRFTMLHALKFSKDIAPAYKIVHLIKYFLTGLMVIVAVLRQIMRKKMKGKGAGKKNRNPFILIYVNSFIGVIIVLLSGVLSALA